MKQHSITFLLPNLPYDPTGGCKVVYEYANRLAADGCTVYICYRYIFEYDKRKILQYLGSRTEYLFRRLFHLFPSGRHWFALAPQVKETISANHYSQVPETDLYVATMYSTAMFLNTFTIEPSRKFYLVQDYEVWGKQTDVSIRTTYHFPMTKFVVARWLQRIIEEEGENAIYLPNGFDFNFFKLTKQIEERNPFCVALLYRREANKGFSTASKALDIVHKKYPQLHVQLFGAPSRPPDIPSWMDYHQKPNQKAHNDLYNESAIFIGASPTEGFGLTIGESMICGCAVACTNTGGFREMVADGETGLLSPVNDSQALANNIIRLIEDNPLRIRLAQNANLNIQHFTWNNSYNILKNTLLKNICSSSN